MGVTWDDAAEEIIRGDLAAAFGYLTPARGVVVVPMAPMGLGDRDAGTLLVSTSLGLPKKLLRLRADPSVALGYHAREHSSATARTHLLAQGTATVADRPDRAFLESITPDFERSLGPRRTGLWDRWLDVYYWQRVTITVDLARLVACPGDGRPVTVTGAALPADPAPQRPPNGGTGPRVDVAKVAGHAQRLPHTLLGWVGGDGLPVLARVRVEGVDAAGLRLRSEDLPLPQGGRRAGLTSHEFRRHLVGQEQRVHTGWLEVDGDRAVYAPHTRSGYRMPPSKLLMDTLTGPLMRRGMRRARKDGLVAADYRP